jgi:2-dehydropantoate 2-reductase
MRFMVFGAGALGSLVAARLSAAHDVTLVGRREHVEAIRTSGLRVTGRTECVATSIEAVTEAPTPPDVTPPDVVLVTTKSYGTAGAVEALERFAKPSIFVSLQNGLGNEEILAEHVEKVLGAVINQGVTFLEPGAVYHAGEGETALGAFQGTEPGDAERVAAAFRETGLPAHAVDDIRTQIWLKAILNAAVNPLTALLGKRTGELVGDPALESAIRLIVHESVAIARAAGIALEENIVLEKIWSVARATKDNKSSMLQDLERGRRTEIDAINGALLDRARALGVAAPQNELLFHLIRAAQGNKIQPAP